MKKLAKKLDENPIASRCANVPECIELVKKRKRPTVFIHVIEPSILLLFINQILSKLIRKFYIYRQLVRWQR